MHCGFALDLSDTDLWNIDLLDTHLDLLDTDIPSKHFACLQDFLKTSSRDVFKTPWRRLQHKQFFVYQDVLENVKLFRWSCVGEVFKTCLQDVFKMSWRPKNVFWDRSHYHAWKLLFKVIVNLFNYAKGGLLSA